MQIEELALRVNHQGHRITESELVDVEKELPRPFPEDFRRFLVLSGGGGELSAPLVYEWESSEYAVALFCAPGGDEYHSIRPLQRHIEEMDYVCAGVPSDIYVIADDWGGDFLTIDLRPESFGQIGLVDHETVGDQFEDDETHEVIAPSFSAFVAGLHEANDEEPDDGQLPPASKAMKVCG